MRRYGQAVPHDLHQVHVAVPEVREVRVHQDVISVLDAPIVPGVHAVPVYPEDQGTRPQDPLGHGNMLHRGPGRPSGGGSDDREDHVGLAGLFLGRADEGQFQARGLRKLLGGPAKGFQVGRQALCCEL